MLFYHFARKITYYNPNPHWFGTQKYAYCKYLRKKPYLCNMTRGRFAPSPTGRMHLGNVFCALLSWLSAKSKGGEWVLRIEDLDPQRSKRDYALQLMDDLQWLGLPWDGEPVWQSQRGDIYEEYLQRLTDMGLTYPCYCTRADIMATQAPHETDGRVVYKGTCRPKYTDAARSVPTSSEEDNSFDVQRPPLTPQTVPLRQGDERSGGGGLQPAHPSPLTSHLSPLPATTRLIVPDCTIPFTDGHYDKHDINLAEHCGDYIIRRKDGAWAYQLAVVVDDALMGVTEIVRGRDLLLSSPQQIHLRNLLFQSTDDREQRTDGLLKRKTITDAARSVPTATLLNVYNSPSETGGVPQSGEGVDNPLNVNTPTIMTDAARSVPTTTSLNVYNSPSETGGVPQSGEGVDSSLNVYSSTIIADTACRVPTATSLNVYPSTLTPHPSPLTVDFFHHPLLCNAEGQRLCKRDKSMDLGYLRGTGITPQEIIGKLAYLAGLTDTTTPITPSELLPLFSWDKVPTEDIILNPNPCTDYSPTPKYRN